MGLQSVKPANAFSIDPDLRCGFFRMLDLESVGFGTRSQLFVFNDNPFALRQGFCLLAARTDELLHFHAKQIGGSGRHFVNLVSMFPKYPIRSGLQPLGAQAVFQPMMLIERSRICELDLPVSGRPRGLDWIKLEA